MQTIPTKSRTALTVGAILLGLVIVGAMAFSRSKAPAADNGQDLMMTEQTPYMSTDSPLTASPTDSGIDTATAAPTDGTELVQPALSAGQVPETHVVAEGETLRSIARLYYNDPVYAGDIEALNGLGNPDDLQVGKTLKLPRPDSLKR